MVWWGLLSGVVVLCGGTIGLSYRLLVADKNASERMASIVVLSAHGFGIWAILAAMGVVK